MKIKRQYGTFTLSAIIGCLLSASIVMLAISLHKIHQDVDDVKAYYFTVHSTAVTYDQVQQDPQGSATKLQSLIGDALAQDESQTQTNAKRQKRAIADRRLPDMLGISPHSNGGVIVVCGISYPTPNAPTMAQIEKRLDTAVTKIMNIIDSLNGTFASIEEQLCKEVSSYSPLEPTPAGPPVTTPAPTNCPPCDCTSTTPACPPPVTCEPPTVSCTTPAPATCPTQTCPTDPSTCPTPTWTCPTDNCPTISPCPPCGTAGPLPCGQRDVILLIDVSNATSQAQFDQLKDFINYQLIMQWPIRPTEVEVGTYSYAAGIFNQFTDFDLNSAEELFKVIYTDVFRLNNRGPQISRALRATLDIQRYRNVPAITVLLSSSSDQADVNASMDWAYQLQNNGSAVLTVAFGSANATILGQLASSPDYSLQSPDFSGNQFLANTTRGLLCVIPPTHPPTTRKTTTRRPTTPHPDLDCQPDIALMFDTSSAATLTGFNQTINFARQYLAGKWNIGRTSTEAAAILYAKNDVISTGQFQYRNNEDLDRDLAKASNLYTGIAPSITDGIIELKSVLADRRSDRKTSVILFTYSSIYDDIAQAVPLVNDLRSRNVSFFIAALGSANRNLLSALSGSVLVPSDSTKLDNAFAEKLNALLCDVSSTPQPLPPTTTATPTMSTTTPTLPTIPLVTTTVSPAVCPNCVPPLANILILIESSNGLNYTQFKNEISFVGNELTQNWTMYERLALGAYSTRKGFYHIVGYNDLLRREDLNNSLNDVAYFNRTPEIASALLMANQQYTPDASYGKQHVIFFTSTKVQSDIDAAVPYAEKLKALGKLIVIATGMSNGIAFTKLTPEGNIVVWPDYTNTTGIANQIMQILTT